MDLYYEYSSQPPKPFGAHAQGPLGLHAVLSDRIYRSSSDSIYRSPRRVPYAKDSEDLYLTQAQPSRDTRPAGTVPPGRHTAPGATRPRAPALRSARRPQAPPQRTGPAPARRPRPPTRPFKRGLWGGSAAAGRAAQSAAGRGRAGRCGRSCPAARSHRRSTASHRFSPRAQPYLLVAAARWRTGRRVLGVEVTERGARPGPGLREGCCSGKLAWGWGCCLTACPLSGARCGPAVPCL